MVIRDQTDPWLVSARKTERSWPMTDSTRKRSTLVVIAIVIVILSGATLIQFAGRTGSPVQSGTPTSNSSASPLVTKATSSSSSASRTLEPVKFLILGDFPELPATPSATLTYTITISQTDKAVGHVALSAVSTVPGVTATLDPKEFTFLGAFEAVSLKISVDPTVSSPTLPIELVASTFQGVTNSSFSFTLEKELIVIQGDGSVKPTTMHATVGQTVKWLNLIPVDDDGNGYVDVKLADGSAASPTMVQNDIWSHTFDRPGTYTYHVTSLNFASLDSFETVEVSK
jgi:plastocyanin